MCKSECEETFTVTLYVPSESVSRPALLLVEARSELVSRAHGVCQVGVEFFGGEQTPHKRIDVPVDPTLTIH